MKLNRLFSDDMVLQREIPIPVWGMAEPGEQVTVSLSGQTQTAKANASGAFRVSFAPLPAGGPHTLSAQGAKDRVLVRNVLVGEVWICSGQSNMEWTLSNCADGQFEVEAAQYPAVRMFRVPQKAVVRPQTDTDGAWAVCTPATAGNFSGVGYFFARELHRKLGGIPVGMINTSWGGTLAEAWTSRETLLATPEVRYLMENAERIMQDPAARKEYEKSYAAWERTIQKDPGDTGWARGWASLDTPDEGWGKLEVPGAWQSKGMDFSGIVWFRREVEVPAAWAGKDLQLSLGPCDKSDITWFNNEQVGSITMEQRGDAWCTPRLYTIPGRLVRAGRNVIAVRIFSNMYAGGFIGQAGQMYLTPVGCGNADGIALAGDWLCRVEANFGKVNAQPPAAPFGDGCANTPAALYNGMIAPLLPYAIRGAIWYQGESNSDRAHEYTTLFPAMIQDWRRAWAMPASAMAGAPGGDFPFYFVQLANFGATKPNPSESTWAELREAQRLTLREPNTGMAVTIDVGDGADIHPTNKQDVGRRLAYGALAQVYGQCLPWSGPVLRECAVEEGCLRLSFDHAEGGLVTPDGGPVRGFAIAGATRRFRWASARIEGDSIVIRHPHEPNPVAVRYAWDDNPVCNLFNRAGLPASPFRTDEWTWITRK